MKFLKKTTLKFLNVFGITPFVYQIYKYNKPFDAKKMLITSDRPVIFDVGAHVGMTAKEYLKIFPKSKIYSFEPTPNTFNILNKNVLKHENIRAFNLALSSTKGEASFFVNNSSLTNSLLEVSDNYAVRDIGLKMVTKVRVKTDTIDCFMSENKIPKIDLLKIDVQGAELEVLKGAEIALKSQSIDLIYLEVEFFRLYNNQPLYHHLAIYLENFGYQLHSIYNFSFNKKSGQLVYGDALFVKNKLN